MNANGMRLCYLKAANVIGPTGQLAAMPVRGRTDQPLGTVDGVLIDPERRRLQFVIVRSPNGRGGSYLLPIDSAAHLERGAGELRVETDDLSGCQLFDRASVEDFTAEDAIAPTLRRYIA
jgi:hypothetical protein